MLKFPNFGCPPGQPCLLALFSIALGQKSKFPSQLLLPVLLFSKRYDTTPWSKTQGGDRFGRKSNFWGAVLTLRASGSKSPAQQLLTRSYLGPEILLRSIQQVLQQCADTQTYKSNPPHYHLIIFLHVCEGEGGKLQTLLSFYLRWIWDLKKLLIRIS